MLKRTVVTACLMILLHPYSGFAAGDAAQEIQSAPILERVGAWQNIRDFEETRYFSVAGPPTKDDAEHAIEETRLYEDMVQDYYELDDEDDADYAFIVEALFEPEDASRPASLRNDDSDEAISEDAESPNLNSSIYVDSVRPTFLPGMQIKPRAPEPEKKQNTDARSLFADILKPKADEIMGEEIKPIVAIEPEHKVENASENEMKDDEKNQKAGNINAPTKQRAVSPDEETLNLLKQAVKEVGVEKRFKLGNTVDGHQLLETSKEDQHPDRIYTDPARDKAQMSKTFNASNHKKKSVKPPKRLRKKEKAPEVEAIPEPPKEESFFDIF